MQRSYVQHKRNRPESQWVEGRNYEFSRKMKVLESGRKHVILDVEI